MNGLYAIVDPDACAGRDPIVVARAIVRGGCVALQLRDKRRGDRAVLALARAMAVVAREGGVPFFVDDRLDVAIACGADGVHLGREDLPLAVARAQAPAGFRIGVSTHDEDECARMQREGADLVGYGPVFATSTKENPDPIVGIASLGRCVRAASVPVVAIGGITLASASILRAEGVRVAASISAVGAADDPERAARALHAALRGERA